MKRPISENCYNISKNYIYIVLIFFLYNNAKIPLKFQNYVNYLPLDIKHWNIVNTCIQTVSQTNGFWCHMIKLHYISGQHLDDIVRNSTFTFHDDSPIDFTPTMTAATESRNWNLWSGSRHWCPALYVWILDEVQNPLRVHWLELLMLVEQNCFLRLDNSEVLWLFTTLPRPWHVRLARVP